MVISLKLFKYCACDIDGTLLDSMPAYEYAFCETLRANFSIPKEESIKFYDCTAGTPLPEQYRQILKKRNEIFNEKIIQKLCLEFFEIAEKEETRAYKEAREFLEKLSGQGLKIFATSGANTKNLRKCLAKTGLIRYFSAIIGSDKIPKRNKRHIECFAKICGMPLEEFCSMAFYVGDGPMDMKIAKECGIYAIGITNTVSKESLITAGAKIIIENLKELTEEETKKEK